MAKAVELLIDRPIAFNRAFVALGVGVTGALMLSQAVYWQTRIAVNGWFYKTGKDWTDETGLTRAEQETARARLEKLGILHYEVRGIPARMHYRVDIEALQEALAKAATRANKFAGIPQTGLPDSSKQPCGNSANSDAESAQTKESKTTKETTAETKTDISFCGGQAPADVPVSMVLKARDGTEYQIPAALKYPKPGSLTHKTWAAYAIAYMQRYGAWPIWNGSVAGQVARFIRRVGEERAPRIAVHYVRRVNEQFVVQQMHPVKLLLNDAEKWATQTETGSTMTRMQAQQVDKTESNASAAEEAAQKAMAMLNSQGGVHG